MKISNLFKFDIGSFLKPKNPIHWYGLIFWVFSIIFGGVIGAGVGAVGSILIVNLSNTENKNSSKVLGAVGITLVTLIVYFVIVYFTIGY